ncbi:MAG TPA: hypothetical protein VIH99_00930 [Bdellovibrionota bacterium]|jgi:DNA polymerase-3 subunit delta'
MSHNKKILQGLLTAEAENRLHHAYILAGPASRAKLECVEMFAAEIFSKSGEQGLFGNAGGSSGRELERVQGRNHPDFSRLDAVEGKLGIDEVRELPRILAFAPLEAKRRVVVLPEAAAMNAQAANCILKTLEEPPPHSMFFLLCREPSELLQTIVSRCQVLRFAPLSDDELLAQLEGKEGEAKDAILAFSEGALERAELLLADEGLLALRKEACERLLELWEASPRIPSKAALWVEKIEGEERVQVVLDSWEILLRDLAFVKGGASAGHLRFRDCHPRLEAVASKASSVDEIAQRSSAINRFRVYRRLNGNLRLDLAALLSELQILLGKGPGLA